MFWFVYSLVIQEDTAYRFYWFLTPENRAVIHRSLSDSRFAQWRGRARSGLGRHRVGRSILDPFTKPGKFILSSPRSSHVQDYTAIGARSWDSSIGLSDPRAGLPLNETKRKVPQRGGWDPGRPAYCLPGLSQVAQEEREGAMGQEWLIAQVDLKAHLC